MPALPDAKKSPTVAPMPRSRFSSAGRFAGRRAPLKLCGEVGGVNEARGVAVRDRNAALGRCRPGADLPRQRHRRDHPVVVRERGDGAADRRCLLRPLGQVPPHHQRASPVRRLHCVRLPVVTLCQSLCDAGGGHALDLRLSAPAAADHFEVTSARKRGRDVHRQPHFTSWRESTSRTASTSLASGTANCAGRLARHSWFEAIAAAALAPSIKSLICTSPRAFSSPPWITTQGAPRLSAYLSCGPILPEPR